ncbi:hypothetical protein [Microcoleus sp. CAWBG640]|uniref:hypothetical protein n=1 Tax=Microcoleus sp. CAWBG640 TaxID=2841653 RepID=UPI00312BBFD0
MRFLKIVLVVLVMAANLVFAPASLAGSDKPKYTSNPDYLEVNQTLNTLLEAKKSTE